MGVEFDRILDAFTGPFEHVKDWNLEAAGGPTCRPRSGAVALTR